MDNPYYNDPSWYELIHAADASFEAAILLRVAKLHGNPARDWLEPACGGGRVMAELVRRGAKATGYDSNPAMRAHAARRGLDVADGRMESWRGGPFDAAFTLHGSFRHLLTQKAALSHLRATADSLRPGGLYIVGLDLCRYGEDADDEELWEAEEGRRAAKLVVTTLPPEPRRRRERVMNFLWWKDGRREGTTQSEYDLRSYDRAQWRALIAASPFRLLACYTVEGRRIPFDARTRHGLFVLGKGRRLNDGLA